MATVLWTLSCNNLTKTAAVWGVSGITRQRRSQATDSVTFTAPGRAVDAAPLFPYEATVIILRNNVRWFVGRVTRVPSDGDGSGETQSYELSGPWWYLEKLVCRQEWKTQLGTLTALSTRLILGQALDGGRLTTGAVIEETIHYAIDSAAPLALGTVDVDLLPPLDEVKDVTCAEVIKHMLRWHPDAVAWFDYTTAPHPTLHVRRRANLAVATVKVGVAPLSKIGGITARKDLKPPAVVIHYEVTGNVDGQPTFKLMVDAAPENATGREFGAACFTIPLRGVTSAATEQRVVTRGIRDSLSAYSSDTIRDYLTCYYADLAMKANNTDITKEGITITSVSRGLSDANAKVYDPDSRTMVPADYDDTLNNQLLEGAITDWMVQGQAIRTQVHRIYVSYTCDSGTGEGSGSSDIQSYSGALDITATNAGTDTDSPVSNIYTTLTNYDDGDSIPLGLAAAYLAGLSKLQYSGSITLVEEEVTGAAHLGQVLNITGSAQSAWASMAAMIVEESVEVDTGTTTITFGPPEHLTPQDLVALLRVARPGTGGGRAGGDGPGGLGTSNSATRTSGVPGGAGANGAVSLGVSGPVNNACPEAGSLGPLVFNVAANGQPSFFKINAAGPFTAVPAGASVANPD